MLSEKEYKNILGHKSITLNILWYALKDAEDKSWTTAPDGSRQRDFSDIPINHLMAYGESFLFELGSFLDIFMKYICGKKIDDKTYFNRETLLKLLPDDDFVKFLKECWNKGISSDKRFSSEKMKEYRNSITHQTILDMSKIMSWKKGQGFPELKNNFYILPDNPKSEPSSYTYNEQIALFGFFEEMSKIFDEIIKKLNEENLFNKYTY